MTPVTVSALIAEDEPLLAQALRAELARAWPDLHIAASVGDGASAVQQALALAPDVLFLDIRMPGLDGLQAAAELADQWEAAQPGKPFPALVYVTAYDQYAVQAFEAQAVDYLLKPVQTERLQKTVDKLQRALQARTTTASTTPPAHASSMDATLAQLRALLAAPALQAGAGATATDTARPPLTVIQASVGNTIHMVSVQDVLCLQAADKYVRVLTAAREYLIRTPLKELQDQLDPHQFWQIHRGTIVRAQSIESVTRDESGKAHVHLRSLTEPFPVSRLYAHLFKAM